MNKTIEFEWNGQTYNLLMNAAALFACYDKFGDQTCLLDHITGTSQKSLYATAWMMMTLSHQGELLRRYQGYEPSAMLDVNQIMREMGPKDLLRARRALRRAYNAGFDREIPSDEDVDEDDIDLGLLELQKKTALGCIVRNISSALRKFCASL